MPSGRNNLIQWVEATLSSSCAIEAGRGVGRGISGDISAGMGGAGTWYPSGERVRPEEWSPLIATGSR